MNFMWAKICKLSRPINNLKAMSPIKDAIIIYHVEKSSFVDGISALQKGKFDWGFFNNTFLLPIPTNLTKSNEEIPEISPLIADRLLEFVSWDIKKFIIILEGRIWKMWVFYLISLPLTLGMVVLTVKYFSGPDVPRYVFFTVGYTWFCSIAVIVLVPADIWTVNCILHFSELLVFYSLIKWITRAYADPWLLVPSNMV